MFVNIHLQTVLLSSMPRSLVEYDLYMYMNTKSIIAEKIISSVSRKKTYFPRVCLKTFNPLFSKEFFQWPSVDTALIGGKGRRAWCTDVTLGRWGEKM